MFRNVLYTSSSDPKSDLANDLFPKAVYFIEDELKEILHLINAKSGLGGNGNEQGQWTQAGVAALLVRLYLNAEVYIGEAR